MIQSHKLPLDRCPHCSVARPNLDLRNDFVSQNHLGNVKQRWACYSCQSCGGAVMTRAPFYDHQHELQAITNVWPGAISVEATVPGRARDFLEQAISCIHAPAGAVMLTASSVDAMLKAKGLSSGSLYKRIEAAAEKHLITAEMAEWAHEVRLDANDQRHADEAAGLPSEADARRAIDFTRALAQFLFVLPARVASGRERASEDVKASG